MSWLRDHFHNFVFPAFMAAGKKSTEIGEPFDVRPSQHAPEKLPSELRKLWTLCKEHEVEFAYDVREVNKHGGTSKYRERARVDHNVLNNTIDSAMAAMRAEGCDRLFLGGRDVWAFAVMCERRRIPYLYVPELSRYVSSRPEVKGFLEERGFRGEKELFLDTGYVGSIPRNLQAHFPGNKFKFRLMSQTEQFVHQPFQEGGVFDSDKPPHRVHREAKKERWKRRPNQLFPNRKTAREEAMFQEYVAKYQASGTFSEPMTGAPLGQANAVFKEWLHKPNIWRYDDVKRRTLCITDGKEAVAVSLADLKVAPGLHEWWKSLPKGPAWVPPDHKMGEIVQFLSDRQSIQRAAVLTSCLWRGIPHFRAMTYEPSKVVQKVGAGLVNTAGISNLLVGDGGGNITFSSNSATSAVSTAIYSVNSTNGATSVWIPGKAAPEPLPAGFVMKKGEDENGMPALELVQAQLGLFDSLPKDVHGPKDGTQLALFSKPKSTAFKVAEKVINTLDNPLELLKGDPGDPVGQCDCGPEEACSDCPNDKVMTFTQFQQIAV